VLWILSSIAARRIARPLRELSQAAADFGAGNLARRVRLRRGASELLELQTQFNQMAARIEAQVKSQKELLGAVSHELRTPLARLRVLLDVLAEKQGDPKLVSDMEREIVEMDALVGELLAGARVEAGALQMRELDVSDLVGTCLERVGLDRQAARCSPGCERVRGDATLLSRALIVLLDNAQKHGGGVAQLRVSAAAEQLEFAVDDAGRGFDPADLPRLFVPFARGRGESPDEARGLGLGLYLVRRIAEAHGGSAFAENRQAGGAAVGFRIPQG
jgi:signal transduction histidine kinase